MREDVERFQREREQDGGAARAAGRRILIVDDEAGITRYLTALLDGFNGARTAFANDGFTAGHLVHVFRPDIVLLDLMMPGLDGFQVCRQIKSDAETCHIRVIAMTGYPTPEHYQRIIAAGAECCLDKPLDEAGLLDLIRADNCETARKRLPELFALRDEMLDKLRALQDLIVVTKT